MAFILGDDFSRQTREATTQEIKCPDCGEPLPDETKEGDICCICSGIYKE